MHDGMVQHARLVAHATNWARDLVNEPAGTMTPTILADAARTMAKEVGLNIAIGDRKKITELKMGMFLGVARGSIEEPRLVQLSYIPRDPEAAKRAPVCFVGKAITFDSGGLSLKPSDGMMDMKTDMAGSAAVLGAMKVIARVAPPFPVHAFFGACENMPDGNAYRLGDILVSKLGKTVEITNTDAEGRLVLGDILAYANELKPAALIDLATLTGACIIGLGNYIAGAFAADDQLFYDLSESARLAGEEIWRLPLTEFQRDVLKSEVADLKNAGDRAGGAISAALFLKEFVGDTPWVHLDIAGPSQSPRERGYLNKGATGIGVRTLVEFISRRTEQLAAAS
jgi:leucyl aminopeptidase